MGVVANFICFPQCKYFENRLRFDKVTESLKVETFLRHSVYRMIFCKFFPIIPYFSRKSVEDYRIKDAMYKMYANPT